MMITAIPAELWAIIVGYAYAEIPELFEGRQMLPPDYWLLCRSLTDGLDEWIRLKIEERLSNGNLRLLPIGPPFVNYPHRNHKRALLALSRSNLTFPTLIHTLEGPFLALQTGSFSVEPHAPPAVRNEADDRWSMLLSNFVSSLTNLTTIGTLFVTHCRWIRRFDIQTLTQLKHIGDDFLADSHVEEVLLPDSLETVGDEFLAACPAIVKMDFSHTRLTAVGYGFLRGNRLKSVLFPPTLSTVGSWFLSDRYDDSTQDCSDFTIDLSETVVECIGGDFLDRTKVAELKLPSTLRNVGKRFLHGFPHTIIDLACVPLVGMGSDAFESAAVEKLLLPSTLESVPRGFLRKSLAKRLEITADALETVGPEFLYESRVEDLSLPPSLITVGAWFLSKSNITRLDLSKTGLRSIGEESLHCCRQLTEINLPPTLTAVGDSFLKKSTIAKFDARNTSLAVVGHGLLSSTPVVEVYLPGTLEAVGNDFLSGTARLKHLEAPSLRSVGDGFLAESHLSDGATLAVPLESIGATCMKGLRADSVDLSLMRLKCIGIGFLMQSSVKHLRLPDTLTSLGESCLKYSTASRVTVFSTSLERIGNNFLAESPVGTILLPSSLRQIGRNFLSLCYSTAVEVQAPNLTDVGEGFLVSSRISSLKLPVSLKSEAFVSRLLSKKLEFS